MYIEDSAKAVRATSASYSAMVEPQVSVLMPVRNAERYVAEAVESILSQTFTDFEFLIFDDGSTDRSLSILEKYVLQDERVHLFPRPQRGIGHWLNEGIGMARGEFVARMDADDVSLSRRFACQVDYMRRDPACVALGCNLVMIDSDGDQLCKITYETEHETIENKLLNGQFEVISHPACMMRRSALLLVRGYREKYESVEDFDLWLRLAEQGRLANLPEVLFEYRQHHQSVNATKFRCQKSLADCIINEARTRRHLEPFRRSIWDDSGRATSPIERHIEWAISAAGSGFRRTAFKHAVLALKQDPTFFNAWAVFVRCFMRTILMSSLKRLGFSRLRKRYWLGWHQG